MKKIIRFFSIAALALVGAVMTGCSNDDDSIISNQQQLENKSKVVTLTTTVSLDGSATTRALTSTGVKTFAAGETMALVYKNTGGSTVKVVSTALTDPDITSGGKSATFTFELTDPDKGVNVTYVYPAAMANADGTINYDALNSQDGTLATIASNLDLATYTAAWDGDNLPTVTLDNQLAILAISLKDNAPTPNDLTSSTTALTVSDGTNTYSVTRSTGEGPIYVAIRPTSSADITITATTGAKKYGKYLTSKTYAASSGYPVKWEMYKMAASAEAGDLEKLLCTAGHIHADGADGKCTAPRVAKIFYVGSDTCEGTFNHGLALGLTDASTGCAWGPLGIASNPVQYNESSFQPESGLTYNSYTPNHNNDSYPAFKNAIAYNGDVAPAECSDWFLPSAYQLQKMITTVGGHANLREKAGLDYTAATGYYWVCTETGFSLALRYYFGDGNFYYVDKNSTRRVRSCCAF